MSDTSLEFRDPCKGCDGRGEVAAHRNAQGHLTVICPVCKGYKFRRQKLSVPAITRGLPATTDRVAPPKPLN